MRVTVDLDNGWFASLPAATSDFVMRKLLKAQGDTRNPIDLELKAKGIDSHRTVTLADPARLLCADALAEKRAKDFKQAPPWTGAGGGNKR